MQPMTLAVQDISTSALPWCSARGVDVSIWESALSARARRKRAHACTLPASLLCMRAFNARDAHAHAQTRRACRRWSEQETLEKGAGARARAFSKPGSQEK